MSPPARHHFQHQHQHQHHQQHQHFTGSLTYQLPVSLHPPEPIKKIKKKITMDNWPQEIYDHVVSFIERRVGEADVPIWDHHRLPPAYPAIAVISRKFQVAVERYTFRRLRIHTTDPELDHLERALTTSRRRRALRNLSLTIVLPSYPPVSYTEFETDRDRSANNEAVTATLARVFRILTAGDSQDSSSTAPALDLEIAGAYSPPDKRERPTLPPSPSPDGQFGIRPDLYGRRYAFSLLDLTPDVVDFPPLPCVRSFSFSHGIRIWNPRVAVLLTAKMVKATRADWDLSYMENGWGRYMRIDQLYRDSLVESIECTTLPAATTNFRCALKSPQASNVETLPRFVAAESHDPVSCALRHLTRNCTQVSVEGPIHFSFFDPPSGVLGGDALCWQHLAELRVKVDMRGPEGSWLFRLEDNDATTTANASDSTTELQQILPPGYGETEEEREEAEEYYDDHQDIIFLSQQQQQQQDDSSRSIPDDVQMNTLLTAVARACSRLPALQVAVLEAEHDNDDNWPFQVSCVAAGKPFGSWDTEYADGTGSWRVYLHVDEWRPAETTLREFKMVGRARGGPESTVCFLPWGTFDY
ncbi:hypothetical protein F4809DRAFT_602874 [Biscogniauxia mediterranea]|nr:hypothetical protein F4809DRAFT_602874 [Biscogniauxia mediterranea]